jgi:hypothetical protein
MFHILFFCLKLCLTLNFLSSLFSRSQSAVNRPCVKGCSPRLVEAAYERFIHLAGRKKDLKSSILGKFSIPTYRVRLEYHDLRVSSDRWAHHAIRKLCRRLSSVDRNEVMVQGFLVRSQIPGLMALFNFINRLEYISEQGQRPLHSLLLMQM